MAGGKDTTAGFADAETLWKGGRTIGAPWTFIIEPNVPHGIIDGNVGIEFFSNSSELIIPWLSGVIRQRLPQGSTAMRTIDENAGWLADHKTGDVSPSAAHTGSKLDKTWLPDEQSARAWQRIRVTETPGKRYEQ